MRFMISCFLFSLLLFIPITLSVAPAKPYDLVDESLRPWFLLCKSNGRLAAPPIMPKFGANITLPHVELIYFNLTSVCHEINYWYIENGRPLPEREPPKESPTSQETWTIVSAITGAVLGVFNFVFVVIKDCLDRRDRSTKAEEIEGLKRKLRRLNRGEAEIDTVIMDHIAAIEDKLRIS
ncbi:hypothetical protein N7456_007466 [Penicillium angulare]|uniref:Uncharacterized protein n=1 Tax=Penicillium angulare TaxID=116970 RepID=A0A9W9FAZ1_9EURO|nr:hypothetical protein N7456_007466 [Penicillium angulare]